jgi:hypothetical protein
MLGKKCNRPRFFYFFFYNPLAQCCLFKLGVLFKQKEENIEFKSCSTCFKFIKEKKLSYTYSDYSQLPKEIIDVIEHKNYYIINKLSLVTMYCKSFKTASYSYLNQNGKIFS